jgi:hypothetical protein
VVHAVLAITALVEHRLQTLQTHFKEEFVKKDFSVQLVLGFQLLALQDMLVPQLESQY